MPDAASIAARARIKKDYVQQTSTASTGGGGAGQGYDLWDRATWNQIKAQTGSYPFGPQKDGGVIHPPTLEGCPEWAFKLMGLRKPPIGVGNPRFVEGLD